MIRIKDQLEHVYGAGDSLWMMDCCEKGYYSWVDVFRTIGPYRHQFLENSILRSIK